MECSCIGIRSAVRQFHALLMMMVAKTANSYNQFSQTGATQLVALLFVTSGTANGRVTFNQTENQACFSLGERMEQNVCVFSQAVA